jgi:hypothetical protein
VGWALFALNMAVAIWFTSVEWAFIVENCPVCGHGTDIRGSRFFPIKPRRVAREFTSITELITRDLGIACQHEQMIVSDLLICGILM